MPSLLEVDCKASAPLRWKWRLSKVCRASFHWLRRFCWLVFASGSGCGSKIWSKDDDGEGTEEVMLMGRWSEKKDERLMSG